MIPIQEALTSYLAQWIERHIRNRDLIHRKIKTIQVSGDHITVEYGDKTQLLTVQPTLGPAAEAIGKLSGDHASIVTYNTAENFAALVRDWNAYASFKRHFCIYFVNPFSKQDKFWVIYPWSHNAITEPASLKSGLVSVASMVDQTAIPDLTKILAEETA